MYPFVFHSIFLIPKRCFPLYIPHSQLYVSFSTFVALCSMIIMTATCVQRFDLCYCPLNPTKTNNLNIETVLYLPTLSHWSLLLKLYFQLESIWETRATQCWGESTPKVFQLSSNKSVFLFSQKKQKQEKQAATRSSCHWGIEVFGNPLN